MKNSMRFFALFLAAILCSTFLSACANVSDQPAEISGTPDATSDLSSVTDDQTDVYVALPDVADKTGMIKSTKLDVGSVTVEEPFFVKSDGTIGVRGLDDISLYTDGYYINVWENNSYAGPQITEDRGVYFASTTQLSMDELLLEDKDIWDDETNTLKLSDSLQYSLELIFAGGQRQINATCISTKELESVSINSNMFKIVPIERGGNTVKFFFITSPNFPAGSSQYSGSVSLETVTLNESGDKVVSHVSSNCGFSHSIEACYMKDDCGIIEVMLYQTESGVKFYGYYVTTDGGKSWVSYATSNDITQPSKVERLLPYSL